MTAATDFWEGRSIAGPFATLAESRASLQERADLYPDLETFMPTNMPGKTIIDYGCGPGADVVQFLENGAAHVDAIDASVVALEILKERLPLHGIAITRCMRWLSHATPIIRLPHADHIHCAGVIHHLDDPVGVLRSFHTAKPDSVRCMVYDGGSEYVRQRGGPEKFAAMNTGDAGAPIAHAWTQQQFSDLCAQAGWDADYLGGYRYQGEPQEGPPLSGCWSLTC